MNAALAAIAVVSVLGIFALVLDAGLLPVAVGLALVIDSTLA